jgi:hypothetical protein
VAVCSWFSDYETSGVGGGGFDSQNSGRRIVNREFWQRQRDTVGREEFGVRKPQNPKYQFGSDTMLTLETRDKNTKRQRE